jgi:hypothetical protein
MMMMDAAAFRTISDPDYDPARAADHFLGFAQCVFEQSRDVRSAAADPSRPPGRG